jgi:penicillin-binding protein 1B
LARGRKRSRRVGGGWRLLGVALVVAGFAGGFWVARSVVQLDHVVRERFGGRLFRVPSRVLSAPIILYPGQDWKQIELPATLQRLGYRDAASPDRLELGRYAWSGAEVWVHRRAFEHPTRAEPARLLHLRLAGSVIEELRDGSTGRELGAAFLEPELVGAYYGPDHEQRELVRVGDVPPHMIDAILAVEDQRFHEHRGVDFRRILGALVANVRAGGIRQGGSTLTQQLVKNFFLTPERSFERKLQEAVMALIVEARYDKDAILEAYLNEIYLGQRGSTAVHGVGEAARFYFGKNVRNLTLPESASIAAIIKSPNGLSPHADPERTRKRRDLVLELMREQGRIDDVAFASAQAEPLRVAKVTPEPREARYFLDALQRQLPDFYGTATLTTEGLQIYSTLDLRLQRAAARALAEELERYEKAYPKLAPKGESRLEGCVIALRPQTGEVLALVGGRDYAKSQFDRCTQARRPAGSVFKPFVYAAALEPGDVGPTATLAAWVDDTPLELPTPAGPWRPKNFDREHHGRVPIREALERSYNVATARLAQQVGIPRVAEMAERLGIESPMAKVPSLAIGAADITPLELARAYATLANGGIRPHIRTFEDVVDPQEGALERQPIESERVLDVGTAFLVTSMLEGVVDRGTARALRAQGLVGPIAGKTGTSNEERDAWFVGYTPELVAVVWVGFDEPRSLGLAASAIALPVWSRFLREATGGHVRGAFLRPPDVEEIEIDPASGAVALAGCPERRLEYFLPGTEPSVTCPGWSDEPWQQEPSGAEPEPNLLERLFDAWLERL